MSIKKDIEIFCANILALRKKHNLTQWQMARKLHIGIIALWCMEHGSIPAYVTVEVLYYIQKEFGLSAGQMFKENSITQDR